MAEQPALIIAAHGTRDAAGAAAALELVERVRRMLPDVTVSAGFVELTPPTIEDALAEALSAMDEPRAVVVPLMIGTGGHVRADIPESIVSGAGAAPVTYTPHLGPDDRLIQRVIDQIDAARGDWAAADTTVVFVGRGALVAKANQDHYERARIVAERGGYGAVETCFIQVVGPDLPSTLDKVSAAGAKRVVVMPHFLFPGRLLTWTRDHVGRWSETHPDVEARVADVIGPCDELAQVVIDRYRAGVPGGAPVYLAGLVLRDRDVLVVGGGRVASRRLDALLAAGARVRIISPEASELVSSLAEAGTITWEQRPFEAGDCAGAWYVLALTDSPEVNASVIAEAEANHTFAVRGDDAVRGSAYTPATARASGLTVGVVGDRNPIRSARVRDELLNALTNG